MLFRSGHARRVTCGAILLCSTAILVGLISGQGEAVGQGARVTFGLSKPSLPPPMELGATPVEIGMSMIGGSLSDGGDDVGPANEVQDMIEGDHPVVTFSGMPCITWAAAQGGGPDQPYNWSSLDAAMQNRIAGKALTGYYQMWNTSPGWADWENDRAFFWQKFEEFVTATTVYINQNYGVIYYVFENEPNISRAPDGWKWYEWYMHCLWHFYNAVHDADGQTGMNNKVIAGNLCGHTAGGFENLYNLVPKDPSDPPGLSIRDYSDILGYHAYPYEITAGVLVDDLALIHHIQETYGDGAKRIYVSEGWGSGRSAGFDRSSPKIEPPALEIGNMYLGMVNGWDNVMSAGTKSNGYYWHPDYLWGMRFFCGNDNWGAMNWRSRATPYDDDQNGDIDGFVVDGYRMGLDIAPYFWNGGMMDWYGNSKDCLIHVFPGDGLVFMNPGFELPSDPPNAHLPHFWATQDNPASPTNYQLDRDVFHNGSYSMRLKQAAAGNRGISQQTAKRSASEGTSYRARVWCKTEDQAGITAKFYMAFCDLDGTVIGSKIWATDITGTNDWQQMEVIATAPAGTGRIEAGSYINGVGTAWFDDVTISATSQTETGTVRGYTLDDEQNPIAGCIVRTSTGGIQTISDAQGYYEIQGVPTGTYDFVCRKAGFVPHRVRNQTVAADKFTPLSFSMGTPNPGLTVAQIQCNRSVLPVNQSATVTVTVANTSPYPNAIAEVGLFVEQGGDDVTELFTIQPSPSNPAVVNNGGQAEFVFVLSPHDGALGETFEVNAYAYGQEDRPNMLFNGGLDDTPWYDPNDQWTFEGALWEEGTGDYYSPPRSARCYINNSGYTWWNWALNHSANASWSPPSYPGTSYTVGVHHKDNLTGNVPVKLFIEEYYYDGDDWYRNGRRWAAVPHRSAWGHDVMIYETGDPAVTPGLYATNRLKVGFGPQTEPPGGSGYSWWDDLYLKETGDWLADDRATAAVSVSVIGARVLADFDFDEDVDLTDFGHLQACFSGSGVPQTKPGCNNARLDKDDDVDQDDYVVLLGCLSGANVPAQPDCAE